MRTVAVLLMLSSILAYSPTTLAVDDCQTNAGQAQACIAIPVAKPTPPPPAPSVPSSPYFGTYYLWVRGTKCMSPLSNECRGTPTEGAGLWNPAGAGAVGAGAFGILWEESNGLPSLQRANTVFNGFKLADHMVLV